VTPDLTALVLELVEGEDLSAHIARGAMPLAEALPIAKQIADALEAAAAVKLYTSFSGSSTKRSTGDRGKADRQQCCRNFSYKGSLPLRATQRRHRTGRRSRCTQSSRRCSAVPPWLGYAAPWTDAK
jgi:hypothetical protein